MLVCEDQFRNHIVAQQNTQMAGRILELEINPDRKDYFRIGDIGGIMISRRPNTRASTENAPGPRKMMASSIIAPKTTGSIELNKFGVQVGSSENPIPIPPMPTVAPAIGVRRPSKSSTPAARAIEPSNPVTCAGLAPSPR